MTVLTLNHYEYTYMPHPPSLQLKNSSQLLYVAFLGYYSLVFRVFHTNILNCKNHINVLLQ